MAVTIRKKDEITSVADLAITAKDFAKSGRRLFRGQNVDKPLLPKIARSNSLTPNYIEDLERKMLARFRKESTPYLNGVQPLTDWDWLAIAQHQGLPTRLLDWSANALAALWFAVASDPPLDAHGVLWSLKYTDADIKSPGKTENIFTLQRTYVFQPFHLDKRIVSQSAWFSVHKYLKDSEQFGALEVNPNYKGRLTKFVIPRNSFPTIRQELRLMGITQATLFPDLGGLCADIQEEFLGTQRDADRI